MTYARKLIMHALCALMLIVGVGCIPAHAEDYIVKANILAGTCTVDVTPAAPFMKSLAPEALMNGGLHSTTPITLVLACSGSNESSKTATLSVSGKTVDTGLNTDGKFLFNSGSSDVKNYGFVLSQTDSGLWDSANYLSDKQDLALGTPGERLTSPSKTLWVSVGCGTSTTCSQDVTADDAGKLTASIMFTLAYK